jgi:hypothetical protein
MITILLGLILIGVSYICFRLTPKKGIVTYSVPDIVPTPVTQTATLATITPTKRVRIFKDGVLLHVTGVGSKDHLDAQKDSSLSIDYV